MMKKRMSEEKNANAIIDNRSAIAITCKIVSYLF